MAETKNYLIRCDASTSAYLMEKLPKIVSAEPRQSDVRGIGGGLELIVFGTAVLGTIKAVLELVTKAIEAGHTIKEIKIGDTEIKDPKKEDIVKLQKDFIDEQH